MKNNNLQELKKRKYDFDVAFNDRYFSLIAPYNFPEWKQINNIQQIFIDRTIIPEQTLLNFSKLDLWIIEDNKIQNIYSSEISGFIRCADFLNQKVDPNIASL